VRTSVKNHVETVYTIKAPAEEDRVVVIEHPRMGADYKIIEPDPKDVEVTDKYYRLRVAVKAAETKPVKIVLESTLWQSVSITDLSVEQLTAYAAEGSALEPAAKKAFAEISALRQALDDLDQKISAVDEQKENIFQDQERVRENLKSLTVKSAVQEKYLSKLNEQEDDVSKLDQQKQALSDQRHTTANELDKKIAELSF